MEIYILIYSGINLIALCFYGIDKHRAIKHLYRIPEKSLLFLALLGPIGGILGMRLFRHKTRKLKFQILVPLFLIIHIVLVILYFFYI